MTHAMISKKDRAYLYISQNVDTKMGATQAQSMSKMLYKCQYI